MKNNMNNDFINSAINASGGKLDAETIKNAAKTGNASEIINNLSPEDKNKINNLLNDKASLSALLKSPQALEILKKLSRGGKNG